MIKIPMQMKYVLRPKTLSYLGIAAKKMIQGVKSIIVPDLTAILNF
jgi:hypothetical protein